MNINKSFGQYIYTDLKALETCMNNKLILCQT